MFQFLYLCVCWQCGAVCVLPDHGASPPLLRPPVISFYSVFLSLDVSESELKKDKRRCQKHVFTQVYIL